jgi:hypothetical protein
MLYGGFKGWPDEVPAGHAGGNRKVPLLRRGIEYDSAAGALILRDAVEVRSYRRGDPCGRL